MGILEQLKQSGPRKRNTTKGFYFGATEAEGENKAGIQNLEHYFEDYLNILPQINDGRFIYTGRKGSGKSAIAKYIKDSSANSNDAFADLIRLQDFELEKLVQQGSFQDFENKEAVLFEWLILVRIVKLLVLNNDAVHTNEYPKLKKFLERNAGMVNIDKYQIKEILEKKGYDVSFGGLKHSFGGQIGKHFDTKTDKAPFYAFIPALREIIQTVLNFEVYKNKEFWLLFDDLDISFKDGDPSKQQTLTELIRTAKKYNTEILKGTQARILIFLRNDIGKILEKGFPDTSKIFSSYEIKINWYDHYLFKQNENNTQLKKFINKRIALNFEAHQIPYNKEDPWSTLFREDFSEYNNRSAFKYIIDFTSYRPRDLILFFSFIGQEEYLYPLLPGEVRYLLKKYMRANIGEIKSEVNIHFKSNEMDLIFNYLIQHVANHTRFSHSDFINYIRSQNFSKDPEEVAKILYEYSVITYKDSEDNLFLQHRDNYDFNLSHKDKLYVTLPKYLYHYCRELKP